MSDKNVPVEDDQMLSISSEVLDTKETSGETKINLDLDEDSSPITLHDNFSGNVTNQLPEIILEETLKADLISEEKQLTEKKIEAESKQDSSNAVPEKASISKDNIKHLWVSNINHQVKANELKKHFGKYGKVLTAKILSNGKNFYGYISLETAEQATECMKALHKSTFENQLIHVTKVRPNMKSESTENTIFKTPRRSTKKIDAKRSGEKKNSSTEEKDKEHQGTDTQKDEDKKTISNLERKLRNAHGDISRLKRKLDEYEQKNLVLEKNLRKELDKIRSERRRLNQEKDDLEKLKRDHQKQMANDKNSMMKELDEVKALRTKLEAKLGNFLTSTPRPNTSRSPVNRNLRISNESVILPEDRRYRESRNVKRARTGNVTKSRITPPSPPILSEFDRRGPSHNQHFSTNRQYYSDEKRHSSSANPFEFRQKSNFDDHFQEPRSSYPMSYPPNVSVRPVVLREPVIGDRYGNTGQKPPHILGPSRDGHAHYVQNYGNHYGHY